MTTPEGAGKNFAPAGSAQSGNSILRKGKKGACPARALAEVVTTREGDQQARCINGAAGDWFRADTGAANGTPAREHWRAQSERRPPLRRAAPLVAQRPATEKAPPKRG